MRMLSKMYGLLEALPLVATANIHQNRNRTVNMQVYQKEMRKAFRTDVRQPSVFQMCWTVLWKCRPCRKLNSTFEEWTWLCHLGPHHTIPHHTNGMLITKKVHKGLLVGRRSIIRMLKEKWQKPWCYGRPSTDRGKPATKNHIELFSVSMK